MTQSQRTILIIDDSAEDRLSLRRYLEWADDKQVKQQCVELERVNLQLQLALDRSSGLT